MFQKVTKDPKTYEHINPNVVGNFRNIVVSDQSGKSNIMSRLENMELKLIRTIQRFKVYLTKLKIGSSQGILMTVLTPHLNY